MFSSFAAQRALSPDGKLSPAQQRLADAMSPARAPRPRSDPGTAPHKQPLERDIQRAIIDAMRLHPRVLKVVRFNSGGAYFRNAQGKDALVLFSSEPVVDLHIMLVNGWGWLEVKRPGWSKPTDAREERQAAFLQAVRSAGGIGAFVRSVDEALALL